MRTLGLCCVGILVALFADGCVRYPAGKTQTLYVATNGPLHSLSDAIEQSRQTRRQGTGPVRILLHAGTYSLDKPLFLTAEDSGLEIAACRHESPVVSGQTTIGGWKRSPLNLNIWQTEIADVREGKWIFHELFVNGKRRARTRIPEQGYFHVVGLSTAGHPNELQFHPGDIKPEWAQTGDVELNALEAWAHSRNQIREVSTISNIVTLAGTALPNASEPNCRYYIENAPVELRPGQWHLDLRSGLLTYYPEADEDLSSASITAPHLFDLVHIDGTTDQPAYNITFRGIAFADTDWRLDGGSDFDIQAAVEVHAAVQAEFARRCAFEQCVFERLGGYALELGRGCEQDKIIGNEMHDLGAGGIRIGETDRREAVTHPCRRHLVTDNHIHHIGLVDPPAVGIIVFLSGQNRIAHNEIDHTYYTAISVGWAWGYKETPCRDNIIEFNHLHDIGQGMLSDMGAVYTLGIQPGTIVRNNLIHDVNIFGYGGWGLYTDEGSSGIMLESNVVYRCQSAGFHQHYGRNNILRNNIFAFNKEGQLAHTRIEQHQSFIFTNNIVIFDTGRLFTGNWADDVLMDGNIYFDARANSGDNQTPEMLRAWQLRGHDGHSLFVDPSFVNPRRENFRLKSNSLALQLGFHQIDLSTVGVRKKFRRP